MKLNIRLTLAAVLICIAGIAAAQDLNSQIAAVRAQDEADRQTMVAATLNLSDADGAAFWPMYRDYRNEMGKAGDRTWKLLIEFADKYEAMTDADASKMLDEVLSIEKQQNEIKTKWMKAMRKKIPAATVARFYQVDNKIDTLLRVNAAAGVPLVEKAK